MSKSKDVYAVTEKTMLGDLVKICVEEVRAMPDVWQKLSETKQAEAIDRMHKRCATAIRNAVRLFNSDGTRGVEVDVDRLVSDAGIKITLSLSRSGDQEQAHAALALVGKPALLVVADAEPHLGGELPKPDKDQPELPLNPADNKAAADAIAKAIEDGGTVDGTGDAGAIKDLPTVPSRAKKKTAAKKPAAPRSRAKKK